MGENNEYNTGTMSSGYRTGTARLTCTKMATLTGKLAGKDLQLSGPPPSA